MRARVACGCMMRDRLLRDVVEIDPLEIELHLAGLDLGQIEQIVEQRDEMLSRNCGCP